MLFQRVEQAWREEGNSWKAGEASAAEDALILEPVGRRGLGHHGDCQTPSPGLTLNIIGSPSFPKQDWPWTQLLLSWTPNHQRNLPSAVTKWPHAGAPGSRLVVCRPDPPRGSRLQALASWVQY